MKFQCGYDWCTFEADTHSAVEEHLWKDHNTLTVSNEAEIIKVV